MRDLLVILGVRWRYFVVYPLRRLAWPLARLASAVKCDLLDRHQEGSPAWVLITTIRVAGFRARPVFQCCYCGAQAMHSGEPRAVVRTVTASGAAAWRRRERYRRLNLAVLALVVAALAVALTTGGAP